MLIRILRSESTAIRNTFGLTISTALSTNADSERLFRVNALSYESIGGMITERFLLAKSIVRLYMPPAREPG